MKSHCLGCASWLLMLSSAFGAELPFDKADEFPAGAYALIANQRVVWFGEMHGTREAPELFLGLVRLVARHDAAPPVVALEIPVTDQGAIDRYLATGDEAILRGSEFFKSEMKDGRSSEALVRLLSRLRSEKTALVCCFDTATAQSAQERDTAMAQNLVACARKFPESKLIVLSGNVHACVMEGTSWDPKYRPAALQLSQHFGALVSFDLAFESGSIYALTDKGFGETRVRGKKWSGTAPHYISRHSQRTDGYDGAIFARTLHGSPPW